jgi:hypothetical protein
MRGLADRTPSPQSFLVTVSPAQYATGYVVTATASVGAPIGGNWLSATISGGNSPQTLTVTVNAANLLIGTYFGTITLSGNAASSVVIPVTPIVETEYLSANPSSLQFSFISEFRAPQSQTINVVSTVPGVAAGSSATTASGGNWLSVSQSSATTPLTPTVAVDPGGLFGPYYGTVTLTSALGTLNIPVTGVVHARGAHTMRKPVR